MRTSFTAAALTSAVAALVAAALAACGSAAVVHDGITATPSFVSGAQVATGSLNVSGSDLSVAGSTVSWPDDGQTIAVERNAPSGIYFRKGTIVGARGTFGSAWTNGTATEVLVRCIARGPVQSHTGSSLVVAGVDARLDEDTAVLDGSGGPIALSSIPDGARVEVHGWPETGTRVRASLVRVLPGTPAVLVRGWTRAAPVNGAFELSLQQGGAAALRVDSTSLPGGVPANALVRVSGDVLTSGAIPTLQAATVAVEAQFLPHDGDSALVEGVVTTRSGQALTLGEHAIQLGANAWIGLQPGEAPDAVVQPGAHLVVQGTVSRGAVIASSVTVLNHWNATGQIVPGSFDIGNPATYGVFTLSGAAVVIDTTTAITGVGGAPLTIVELANLHSAAASGLGVRVRGYTRADGDIQAQAVEVTGT